MFVAAHEMRRLFGRFLLLTGAIALLVVLLLFFQTVAGALTSGLTGGIEHNQADVIVYSDKARKNPSASFLAPAAVDAVAKIDGVSQAAGVAKGQFTAAGTNSDISVIGLDDPKIGGPAEITDGRLPNAAGEALASNPSLSAGDVKFATGDTITVEGVDLTVVGTADGAAFDVSPTLYVTLDDLGTMNNTKASATVPTLLNWVAVIVDDGADPDTVAQRITDQVDYSADLGGGGGSAGGPPAGANGPPAGDEQGAPPSSPDVAVTTEPTTSPTAGTDGDGTDGDEAGTDGADGGGTGDGGAATSDPNSTQPTSTPATTTPATTSPNTVSDTTTPVESDTTVPDTDNGADNGADGADPPTGSAGQGPPAGIPDLAGMPSLGGKVLALDRHAAAQALPGVDQISQSFNILYLLLFIVVTIVTGVFFLILTVQKQDSLVLMRALGASKSDVVRPVLIEVIVVVGAGSLIGVAVAGTMLYALRATFGSTLNPTTTAASVVFILVLGVLASFGSVRRVLAVDPVHAARTAGE